MKTVSKILLVLVVMMMATVIMPQKEVRADDALFTPDEGDAITIKPSYAGSSDAQAGLAPVVERLLGFLQIASALIAVVMIAVTGFRYIIETPEMKNELKKSMIPIIVGILLVFFATSIAKFFIGMFSATK